MLWPFGAEGPLIPLADGVVVRFGGREQGGGGFGGQLVEVPAGPVAGEAIHFQAVGEFIHALLTFAPLHRMVVLTRTIGGGGPTRAMGHDKTESGTLLMTFRFGDESAGVAPGTALVFKGIE